jgi:hypothetical protein
VIDESSPATTSRRRKAATQRNIDLPPQQVELVNAVTDLGKSTVAVVSFARPQGLASVIDRLPAVLTAYYGGRH